MALRCLGEKMQSRHLTYKASLSPAASRNPWGFGHTPVSSPCTRRPLAQFWDFAHTVPFVRTRPSSPLLGKSTSHSLAQPTASSVCSVSGLLGKRVWGHSWVYYSSYRGWGGAEKRLTSLKTSDPFAFSSGVGGVNARFSSELGQGFTDIDSDSTTPPSPASPGSTQVSAQSRQDRQMKPNAACPQTSHGTYIY